MANFKIFKYLKKTVFSFNCGIFITLILIAVIEPSFAAENLKEASRLADDFQRQMPWSKEIPQSGYIDGMPQPEHYTSPSNSAQPQSEQLPYAVPYYYYQQPPLCYNPYLFRYEYCGAYDSYDFRVRFRSKDFIFWWEHKRDCPPGHRFINNRGCYKR